MTNTARTARSLFVFLSLSVVSRATGPTRAAVPFVPVSRPAQAEAEPAAPSASSGAPEAVRIVGSSPTGLVLELAADSSSTANSVAGSVISIPGCDRLAEQGQPDLPGKVVLVGVPQKGAVRLSVSTEGTELLAGVKVRPAPGYDTRIPDTGYRTQGADGFWPQAAAELQSIGVFRDVRVARVRINPVQYNRNSSTVRLNRRVRVTLSFDEPGKSADRPDPLDKVLERMLVNGREAVGWKLDPPADQDSVNFFERSNVWCKVRTETTGIYKITPAELKSAGFSPDSIDPATLKLYSIGPCSVNGPYPDTMVEVPVYVKDNGDGKFNGSDHLTFYAQAQSYWQSGDSVWRFNPYTDRVYSWLTWGGATGRRMAPVSASGAVNPSATAPHHVRLEQDNLCPARSGLLWLQERYFKAADQDTGGGMVELVLPQRDTVYSISGRLYGHYSENELVYYPVVLYLNGYLLDTINVAARASTPPATDFTFSGFPSDVAARGEKPDTFRVKLITTQEEEVYLDYLEVRYAEKLKVTSAEPHIEFSYYDAGTVEFGVEGATGDALLLDVTDPYAPKRIIDTGTSNGKRTARLTTAGFTRLACALTANLRAPDTLMKRTPGALRSPAERSDYYIVCPDEFGAAAELLARYRRGNVAGIANAGVRVARLGDIYDDYAFGMEEPGAIKKFLGAKRPAYALLAGDGDYDYKDNLKLGKTPGVLPYEVGYDFDPEVYSQTAKALDAWYVDFDGQGSSPDLILGRVTVRSEPELRLFLDKVRRYETQPLGFWAKRIILLADDEYLGDPSKPDGIGFGHIGGCEDIGQVCSPLLDPAKVYLTEYPLGQRGSASQAALLSEMDRGALLWCFFGHGAGFQLCHEQTLHITNSVPDIHNGSRIPLAFYGSCGVGRFDDTKYQSIAEELVRKEDGCIATAGATKATSPGSNETFARTYFSYLVNQPGDPVGVAFYSAWNVNTLYHLFGDPATVLRTPRDGAASEVSPDTFYPGGRNYVRDSMPAHSGLYEVSAFEETWARYYHSDVGGTNYTLPGYEIHHGLGSFDTGRVVTSFVVPTIPYPESTMVPDGSYAREPNSCRVSVLATVDSEAYSTLRGGIPLAAAVGTSDREPPQVALFADNVRLVPAETALVPRSFALTGVLTDESGILLVPIPDVMLSLAIGTSPKVDLTPYFAYDKNSTTTGRFQYPVKLENQTDIITVVAADNVVDVANPEPNRRVVSVSVETQLDEALRLTDCLVYPNPTTGPASFTLTLSRAALVSVKVFTLAGRLVRRLEPAQCEFGYNQIHWDGLDKDGMTLANGVYLYKLDARATDNSGGIQSSSASFRDRFIVHR